MMDKIFPTQITQYIYSFIETRIDRYYTFKIIPYTSGFAVIVYYHISYHQHDHCIQIYYKFTITSYWHQNISDVCEYYQTQTHV